jgi:FkbM family methyltransferase
MPKWFKRPLSSLRSAVRLISRNPYRLWLALQLHARRRGLLPKRRDRIGPVKFPFDESWGIGQHLMMSGEYEFETIAVMKRFLKPGGVFLDIGANLGYLSAWGLRFVGQQGRVVAFEPATAMADHLERVGQMNPGYDLQVNRLAVGEVPGDGVVTLAGNANCGSTTMVASLIPAEEAKGTETVRVARLDHELSAQDARHVDLVKIDVEGFELSVLKGMEAWFRGGFRSPVVCELMPSAYAVQGFSVEAILSYMASHKYYPCRLSDFEPLSLERLLSQGRVFNVLFLYNGRSATK